MFIEAAAVAGHWWASDLGTGIARAFNAPFALAAFASDSACFESAHGGVSFSDGVSRGQKFLPPDSSTSISDFGGFGCEANSMSFCERRSVRAVSTGPKTFFLSFLLFVLLTLDRRPLPIFACVEGVDVWKIAVKERDKFSWDGTRKRVGGQSLKRAEKSIGRLLKGS